MASYEEIKTPIAGVRILLNKVVSDDRGHFLDLAEADNPLFSGLKHLHGSIATRKHIARGEHYHYNLREHFFVLGGSALVVLHDFNEDSPTHGVTHAVVLGDGKTKIKTALNSYHINEGKLAQIDISPMVYHAFMPLTDDDIIIFVSGDYSYDEKDYVRIKIEEIPGIRGIFKKLNINQ